MNISALFLIYSLSDTWTQRATFVSDEKSNLKTFNYLFKEQERLRITTLCINEALKPSIGHKRNNEPNPDSTFMSLFLLV